MKTRTMLRGAIAGVWLYQGAWKKVLHPDSSHRDIVAAVPGLPATVAPALTAALGAAESGLAVWVLSGRRRRAAAAVQTVLVVGMNAGGLLFAGERIPRHRRMMARNAVLLATAWAIA